MLNRKVGIQAKLYKTTFFLTKKFVEIFSGSADNSFEENSFAPSSFHFKNLKSSLGKAKYIMQQNINGICTKIH